MAVAVAGWGLLAYTVSELPVTPASQMVLYSTAFLAICGTSALVLELYHARAERRGPRPHAVAFLGTGMRLALVLDLGLWLQSIRMLTAAYVVLLVAAFLFLEFLARQASDDRGRRGV